MPKKATKKVNPVAKPSTEEVTTKEDVTNVDETVAENGNGETSNKVLGVKAALATGDDSELDLEKYDGICEKCNGRTRSDEDHIEDLILRIGKSSKRTPVLLLHVHWPHFSDISRLMQFYCEHCSLHYRGSREFLIHMIRNQTEAGFKADSNNLKLKWSEDIGEQHSSMLEKFTEVIQKIDNEGPHEGCLPLLKQFLCDRTPRYYETAYRNGTFGDYFDPDAKVDTSNGDFLLHEYELHQALDNTDSDYTIEDTDIESSGKYGPRGLQFKLLSVAKNEIQCIDAEATDEKNDPKKPTNLIQCLACNESVHSIRQHLNEVFWLRPQINPKTDRREIHMAFMLDGATIGPKEGTNTQLMYCPVCNYHLRARKGDLHLMTHLKHVTTMIKKKCNRYIMEHIGQVDFIMDLFTKRILGDVTADYIIAKCNERFICDKGGEYTGYISTKTSTVSNVHPNKRPAPTTPVFAAKQNKFARTTNWKTPDTKQQWGLGQKKNAPQLMQFQSQKQKGGQQFQQQNTSGNQGQVLACDLCQTRVMGLDGLKEHLRQSIFTSGPRMAEMHLTCFPKPLAYNNDCQCPACGMRQQSFAACLEHICSQASNVIGDKHMVAANVLIDRYIQCMCRQISLNDVAAFVKQAYSMRGW